MQQTKKEIIEGNKLIAEFMGAVKSSIDGDSRYLRFKEPHAGTETYAFYKWQLKYNASWDWLMPVLRAINEIKKLDAYFDLKRRSIGYALLDLSIDAVWVATVDFLLYYKNLIVTNKS